ncbi:potassium transporter [Adhaeribacter aerolatus]|uniref:Potassium transporter n=1 Tax=Adhaeribacter aerolatus TaxID=670289 RepID=A0A512AT47_9BACT|nr:potassium transporter TrkG [Adhaeribacter aerolatus]GEO02757.1 potassium transporter [Adhaeribacter aerolatus]
MSQTRWVKQMQHTLVRWRKQALKVIEQVTLFLSVVALLLMLYNIGFSYTPETESAIHKANSFLLITFFVVLGIRFLALFNHRNITRKRRLEIVLLLFFFLALCLRFFMRNTPYGDVSWISFFDRRAFTHLVFIYIFLVQLSRVDFRIYRLTFNPALLFIYSFLFLIFAGAGLLLLPRATHQEISILDAFFTATSAVCVTGLTVVDTATAFTPFGKKIIILLIQLGGLGIMTFTSFVALVFQRNSTFKNQLFLQSMVNEEHLGQTFRTIIKIVGVTLLIEAIGALFIYLSIDKQLYNGNPVEQWGFAVFHAISAFCNAGFSTLTDGLYDSRIRYNYNLQLTLAWLIIFGGLGFPIMFNIYKYLKQEISKLFYAVFRPHAYKHQPRLLSVNSKIVLITTAILLVLGTVLFGVLEYRHALQEHSWYGKLVTSFFGSVTPRTAGFNTVSMTALTTPTVLIYLLLMWIGASPASTGGGIKTTTIALAFLNIISIGKARDRLEVMHREIPNESVKRAFGVIFLSFMIIGLNVFLVTVFDARHDLKAVVFEVFSAFATVGLSLGLTPQLNDGSKIIIMLTMFLGRVGIITFVLSFINRDKAMHYSYPSENIIIS